MMSWMELAQNRKAMNPVFLNLGYTNKRLLTKVHLVTAVVVPICRFRLVHGEQIYAPHHLCPKLCVYHVGIGICSDLAVLQHKLIQLDIANVANSPAAWLTSCIVVY